MLGTPSGRQAPGQSGVSQGRSGNAKQWQEQYCKTDAVAMQGREAPHGKEHMEHQWEWKNTWAGAHDALAKRH